mgnify:CR=1 FL=1
MSCMDCVVINRGMSVTKNNRAKGSIYEEKIAAFLKQSGFVILERNYRCKQGEIDIIAKDGKYFVFIRNAAVYYLFSHHLPEETPCRFDAAGIDGEEITYIRNAF